MHDHVPHRHRDCTQTFLTPMPNCKIHPSQAGMHIPFHWIVILDLSLDPPQKIAYPNQKRVLFWSLERPTCTDVRLYPIYRQSLARVGLPVPMLISEIIHYSDVWTQMPLWLINEHGFRHWCSIFMLRILCKEKNSFVLWCTLTSGY